MVAKLPKLKILRLLMQIIFYLLLITLKVSENLASLINMASNNIKYPDFKDIKGQESAKRAIEIGVAGGHNILMIGSPGAGKSMLASRIAGIMPDMTSEEILEHNMINSINSQIETGNFNNKRPYREVHHSCSMAAMVEVVAILSQAR